MCETTAGANDRAAEMGFARGLPRHRRDRAAGEAREHRATVTDQHVYLQPREGRYDAVLHVLGEGEVDWSMLERVARQAEADLGRPTGS